MTKTLSGYGAAFFVAGLLWLAGANIDWLIGPIEEDEKNVREMFFALLTIGFICFASVYISKAIPQIESFIINIGFGMAGSVLLAPYTGNQGMVTIVLGAAVAVILFEGGLAIDRQNFRKLLGPILMLGFPVLFLTAIGTSYAAVYIAQWFGVPMPPSVALLLGAVLASTDPAALVGLFKRLNLMDKTAGVVVIAESALTDVTGTILTLVLNAILKGMAAGFAVSGFDLWTDGYAAVLTSEVFSEIGKEMLIGTFAGLVGFAVLLVCEQVWLKVKVPPAVNVMAMKFVVIATYVLTTRFHGSGYLAVFVMGLLYMATEHPTVEKTGHAAEDVISALWKPIVFGTLGGIVSVEMLIGNALLGIAIGLVFMFMVRPAVVIVLLSPFVFYSSWKRTRVGELTLWGMIVRHSMVASLTKPKWIDWLESKVKMRVEFDPVADVTWKEVIYIAFVCERGAIPAALFASLAKSAAEGDLLSAVGIVIILLTLLVGPSYKPWLAKRLKLVEA